MIRVTRREGERFLGHTGGVWGEKKKRKNGKEKKNTNGFQQRILFAGSIYTRTKSYSAISVRLDRNLKQCDRVTGYPRSFLSTSISLKHVHFSSRNLSPE